MGVSARGRYEPWAVVVSRAPLIRYAKARPVLPMTRLEMGWINEMPPAFRSRAIRYEPDIGIDWLHEREWRVCGKSAEDEVITLPLAPYMIAVIVGEPKWMPLPQFRPGTPQGAPGTRVDIDTLEFADVIDKRARLLWDGQTLVPDGVFDVAAQRAEYAGKAWPPR